MSGKESDPKNTVHPKVEEKNEKILLSKKNYQEEFAGCIKYCFPLASGVFLASLGGLPFLLKFIPYMPLTLEVRALTGLLSGLPLGYAAAKWSRENCEEYVEKTYYYKVKD